MALHHPAVVTGLEGPQDEALRSRRLVVEELADGGHGPREPALVLVGQTVEQRADLLGGPAVDTRERLAPFRRELHDVATPVGVRPVTADDPFIDEPSEDAAEVAGIEVQTRAQVRDVHRARLTQFIEDATLRERERGAQEALVEQTDDVRVKAVETANGVDTLGNGHRWLAPVNYFLDEV